MELRSSFKRMGVIMRRNKTMKYLPVAAVIIGLTGIGFATRLQASETPANNEDQAVADGSIVLSGGSVSAGIGYMWGGGTLSYKDNNYPLKISGLTLVDVGASSIKAKGSVYHLQRISDIEGAYNSVSAGATLGAGGGGAYMKNDKGVVIKLTAQDEGLRLHLSANQIQISLAKDAKAAANQHP